MMCYVGKATKIFIFLLTVLSVLALLLGFRLLRRHHHNNTTNCSSSEDNHSSCTTTTSSPPTFLPSPNFNIPTPPYSSDNSVPPPPDPALYPPPLPPPPPPESASWSVSAPPMGTPTPGSALVSPGPVHAIANLVP